MLLALAGAMSTAELGITLAKMIRAGQVHAISCTAANFEEDIFNLVSHDEYRVIADWRALSTDDEVRLRDEGFNRVTDTCIPETAIRYLEKNLLEYWSEAAQKKERYFSYQYFMRLIDEGRLRAALSNRPQRLVGSGCSRSQDSDLLPWLRRFHARQHLLRSRLRRKHRPSRRD